jgi:hypothetical protein
MKTKNQALIAALLACACMALLSCATAMSSGVDGCESALLPPYRSDGKSPVDFALAFDTGLSATKSFFSTVLLVPGDSTTSYAKAQAICQWQPKIGMGLCGALSLGGWGGYTQLKQDDEIQSAESDRLSYGAVAALRLGFRAPTRSDILFYVPSIQFRYAYEFGPYFDLRAASNKAVYDTLRNRLGESNIKKERGSWLLSLVPLDITFTSNESAGPRIIAEFGWNDRWYPQRKGTLTAAFSDPANFGNMLMTYIMPTNFELQATYQLLNSPWYFGLIFGESSDYLNAEITTGFSLGAGYRFLPGGGKKIESDSARENAAPLSLVEDEAQAANP